MVSPGKLVSQRKHFLAFGSIATLKLVTRDRRKGFCSLDEIPISKIKSKTREWKVEAAQAQQMAGEANEIMPQVNFPENGAVFQKRGAEHSLCSPTETPDSVQRTRVDDPFLPIFYQARWNLVIPLPCCIASSVYEFHAENRDAMSSKGCATIISY